MKYHISMDGQVRKCTAKVRCRLGGGAFPSAGQASEYRSNEIKIMEETYKDKINTVEIYEEEESKQRGAVVSWKTTELLMNEQDTQSKFYDFATKTWSPERQKAHEKILAELLDKYKNVPCERKAIFSAGLPGAGKTTVLTTYEKLDTNNYATVSSDDIKEILAEKGLIPEVEGLTPMEASTLVHEESSHLANQLLIELGKQGKNTIYDFTCSSKSGAIKRIGILLGHEYSTDDMQFVFVDIPIETAKQRAVGRYKYGLNDGIQNDIYNNKLAEEGRKDEQKITVGGRYLPESVINQSKPKGTMYSSVNAETLLDLARDKSLNLPEPIVYDNSGAKPVKMNFKEFANRKQS